MDNSKTISYHKICKLLQKNFLVFFSTHIKISNPTETENLETVKERHEKVIEKLETERINKIKELKELETTKKELEELLIKKINETIAIIPK